MNQLLPSPGRSWKLGSLFSLYSTVLRVGTLARGFSNFPTDFRESDCISFRVWSLKICFLISHEGNQFMNCCWVSVPVVGRRGQSFLSQPSADVSFCKVLPNSLRRVWFWDIMIYWLRKDQKVLKVVFFLMSVASWLEVLKDICWGLPWWLTLWGSNVRGLGSIPVWRTKFPHALWHSQKGKKKTAYNLFFPTVYTNHNHKYLY